MDIVLEVFDQYLGDALYASFLPAFPQSSLASSKPYISQPNGTYSSMRQSATGIPSYLYEPSSQYLSQYLSLEPSDLAYMSQWNRNNIFRQTLSLSAITIIFAYVLYFVFATASYYFVFDKANFSHPKYIKGQIALEIRSACYAMPLMALLSVPSFLAEVRGYTKMYDSTADGPGLWYDIIQFPFFIAFTDCFIYWIHRGLHHKKIYKHLHKAHHKWVVPTPFASHAFHPLDGFAQSIPYHVFPFLFPMKKLAYVGIFTFVNFWTITIHDGEYAMNSEIINGAACHTMHHLYFNYNYGQFTTIWDRIGGSYRKPNAELFQKEEKLSEKEWARQKKEAESMIIEVEGKDDRSYVADVVVETKKVQ